MIGYINAFYLYTVAAACVLPLLLLAKAPPRVRAVA